MNNSTKLVLAGLLLLLLVAPFAAFAPLILIAVGAVLVMMVGMTIRILATGETEEREI